MTQPTNLLILLSDNHNRALAGCYGHPQATTPNLDRIAARGVRFTNAYSASPLCCPARAALATGRFPHQTGYWDNAIVYDGRVPGWMHRLRDQGHTVVSIGKLHFRATQDDNGFTEELLPMHILDGKGAVSMLLRGSDEEPKNAGQWELYMEGSGVGIAPYQGFDRQITAAAIDWLTANGRGRDKPWVLFVSYPSPHPPFRVPGDIYRRHAEAEVTLPGHFGPDERNEHPAIEHLRRIMGTGAITDEEAMRRITAGYLGLVAHLDDQIGQVMTALEDLDLIAATRVLYTSDHGDLYGEHGILGKCCMYEGSIGVPLLMAGPGIPARGAIDEIASHVDLFPTILETAGAQPAAEDADLFGSSLWPAIRGEKRERIGFAEYHATGSKSGTFMLRKGHHKLVYYVGMSPQVFDLDNESGEAVDLVERGDGALLRELESDLRRICDPEAVDARAKADQRAKIEFWGGKEAVRATGALVFTPPPGEAPEIRDVDSAPR